MPMDDAVLLTALNTFAGFVSYMMLLAPVLVALASERRLSTPILAGGGALVAAFGLVLVVLARVLRGSTPPEWLPIGVRRRIEPHVARARSHEIGARDLVRPIGLAVGVDLANVTMLYAALRAVGQHPGLEVAPVGYILGSFFMFVTPIFQGAGIVELSMVVALKGLGVPAAEAVTATLLYRAGEFWLPLAFATAVSVTGRVLR
jgi:uncharacterized membrane protein YbhN (UPF0104 family)